MKVLFLILATAFGSFCHATNVQWSTLTVEKWWEGGEGIFLVREYGLAVPTFYVNVFHDTLTDSYTLSFKTPESSISVGGDPYYQNMFMYENMVFAKEGDIVSSATTRFLDDSKYAVHYGIDDDRYFFGEITGVVPNSDIYLSYICTHESSWYGENRYYYYGWADIYLDSDGNVNAWGAFDEDGGPMVVGGGTWEGGIPEPSGGILFLLGAVVLGLRRRTIRPIML